MGDEIRLARRTGFGEGSRTGLILKTGPVLRFRESGAALIIFFVDGNDIQRKGNAGQI
jgi:hypothetical protein